MARERRTGRIVIYSLAALLAILHHDWWFWEDTTLALGFMPVGLLYHALYSVAAACLWLAAIKWAWPAEVEAFAAGGDGGGGANDAAGGGSDEAVAS